MNAAFLAIEHDMVLVMKLLPGLHWGPAAPGMDIAAVDMRMQVIAVAAFCTRHLLSCCMAAAGETITTAYDRAVRTAGALGCLRYCCPHNFSRSCLI